MVKLIIIVKLLVLFISIFIQLGISNTFASIPGIIAPYLVGVITVNQKQEEWRIVFLITAGIYLVGAVMLFILGSVTLEEWAEKHERMVKLSRQMSKVPEIVLKEEIDAAKV